MILVEFIFFTVRQRKIKVSWSVHLFLFFPGPMLNTGEKACIFCTPIHSFDLNDENSYALCKLTNARNTLEI